MTLRVGTQKSVNLVMLQGLPGDLASARTQVTLAANGLFALGDVTVGGACFYTSNGNQVVSDSTDGTTNVAGFVLRNTGLSPMSWVDSDLGYGFVVPNGSQATVAVGGDIMGIITGINSSGTANHVPTIGEYIWVNLTTGALAAAPSSVATATGYTRTNMKITQIGGVTSATVSSNQTFGVYSGNL
jgi:hypothetical protein